MVRLGDELWRARLAHDDEGEPARESGATVRVESVEGVTLKVR
jgi:membrane protein implicated in regulation of membrane protease activity